MFQGIIFESDIFFNVLAAATSGTKKAQDEDLQRNKTYTDSNRIIMNGSVKRTSCNLGRFGYVQQIVLVDPL